MGGAIGTSSTVWSTLQPGGDDTSDASLGFIIQQTLAKMQTVTLVKVVAVSGGTGPVGSVDVQPLVNMVSGAGQGQEHGTIQSLPYMRMQGGANAIVMDPKIGDIGICAFASRDISAVKASKAPSNPGSNRRFNWSDGLYLGGTLNGTPEHLVTFADDGIHITTPLTIFLEGNVVHTGTFISNGIDVGSDHRHTEVQTGSGETGPPA